MRHQAIAGLPSLLVAAGLLLEAIGLAVSSPVFFTLFLCGAMVAVTGSLLFLWRWFRNEGRPRSS